MKPHELDAACELPVCDGESLMIAEDDTAACANPGCPNFDRWF